MVEWLSTKHYERLTETEVKAELENLLRNCKDESEFKQECRHRFGGPMINLHWEESIRSASICRWGKSESIYASVSFGRKAVSAQGS